MATTLAEILPATAARHPERRALVVDVESVPMTSSGKIVRRMLNNIDDGRRSAQ
jgi:acyl-coenzyme A synthetase/AMP-(fatty) acid ligase